ncbi:MAG TPA: D-glycerate dehydrogenase [Phycisphaerales bacterium]|nr:D-glycerate dehydrogenase [Phycisphaerales bacterium]
MHDHPLVAITRAVPGRVEIPGARVQIAPALPQMSRAELLAFIRGATVVGTMFHDHVDAEFLQAAGPQLKGVCNYAVGVDNIDLALCRSRNVIVTNTPDAVTEGTANLAFGLLLAVARKIVEGDRFCRSGRFETEGNTFPTGWCGMHLAGQTMLIVGAGRIGRAVAMRAQAFGMRILYFARSRHLEFEQAPLAAKRVTLEDGLPIADVVSVHTPLTPDTRHILNAASLALLKPTAIVINTSRGPTIDETALAEALFAKRIWGAGLDVFEHEPKIHQRLLALDNVVLTPHIGSAEQHWREEMTRLVCENAAAIVAGRKPANIVV